MPVTSTPLLKAELEGSNNKSVKERDEEMLFGQPKTPPIVTASDVVVALIPKDNLNGVKKTSPS